MADLTKEIALNTDWTNVTRAGALEDGKTYAGNLLPADQVLVVYQAVTDDGNPPSASITGHAWSVHPVETSDGVRHRTLVAGDTLWLKVETGTATLVLTES